MEAVRPRWTDDRIDDLRADMTTRFAQVDSRFVQLEQRMDEGFRELRAEMHGMRTEINARFDAMLRTMIVFGASMFAAMLGLIATQL